MTNKLSTIIKNIILIFIFIAVVFTVFAGIYAYTIITDDDIITVGVGEKYTLTPKQTDFFLRSYNPDIISPDDAGSVVGVAPGEGIVGIKYSYFDRDFYRFKVIPAPETITLNYSEFTLGVLETFTIKVAENSDGYIPTVTYSSSDSSVASVTQDGLISAKGVGVCEITVLTYNKIESKCVVTVMSAPTDFSLNENKIILGEGEQKTISVLFNEGEYSSSVSFTSTDENIATAENSVIKANSVGECEIIATTHNKATAKCKVSVKKLPSSVDLFIPKKHITGTSFSVIHKIPDDTAISGAEISVSDDSVLKLDEKDKNLIHCIKNGTAEITLTLPNGVTSTQEITVDNYRENSMSFTTLNQYPSLPTGCEVVALTSVLRHYGFNINAITMADKYLPKNNYSTSPLNPYKHFIGDPKSQDGCGCFSSCIVKTAENYFEANNIDGYIAVDITGCSTDELYSYLENDIPVITWVTSGFADPYVSSTWVADGKKITWCNHEHCLVTTGYNKNSGLIYVSDNSGGYNYSVSISQYEKVFKGMGSMAVVILKK